MTNIRRRSFRYQGYLFFVFLCVTARSEKSFYLVSVEFSRLFEFCSVFFLNSFVMTKPKGIFKRVNHLKNFSRKKSLEVPAGLLESHFSNDIPVPGPSETPSPNNSNELSTLCSRKKLGDLDQYDNYKPSSGKLRSAPTPSICNENFDDPTSAKECPGVTSPSHPSPEPLLEDSEVKIETMPNQEASADIRAISLSPSSPSNQDAASTRHGVKRKKAPSGEYKTALVSRLEQVLAIANKKPSRGEVLEMAVGSCYRDLLESGLQDLASSFYAASLKLVANYEEKSLAAAKKLLR